MTTACLAIIANRIAADHAGVCTKFASLSDRVAAGVTDDVTAISEAEQLGVIRINLEAEMDSVLRAASGMLAKILMPAIMAEAAVLS